MLRVKKLIPVFLAGLICAGCADTTITRLTAPHAFRAQDGFYRLEVQIESHDQAIQWDTMRASAVIGSEVIQLKPTAHMTNRWEGFIRVPPGQKSVEYHFKIDYKRANFGVPPQPDTRQSHNYTLEILE